VRQFGNQETLLLEVAAVAVNNSAAFLAAVFESLGIECTCQKSQDSTLD
jgi:hypothetical protein